jgi:acetyltransferase
MAFVADYQNPQTQQHEILGVGRLIKEVGANEARFALLVADRFQRKGLGTELLRQLIQFAYDEHIQLLTSDILMENLGMLAVCKKLGISLRYSPEDHLVQAKFVL